MYRKMMGFVVLTVFALLMVACNADGTLTPAVSAAPPAAEQDSTIINLPIVITAKNETTAQTSNIVDTGQDGCYDNSGQITCPETGQPFVGQDAQYDGLQLSYADNGDGTITDLNTGLMWQQSPGDKATWADAMADAGSITLGGYDDWRVPTIKELYALMDFNGMTGQSEATATPYIDTDYFVFEYGDTAAGERYIDAQYWSDTEYVSTTMNDDATVFGVNFADGRIKGYPKMMQGSEKLMFVRYVRGDSGYGENDFVDNGDGTVTDNASGLMWQQVDDRNGRSWEESLAYCESATIGGYEDWRLPNAKELQGIVDYGRSPDTTNSAAIDPIFIASTITDPNGDLNYGSYWTSTTHLDGREIGSYAVYIAFGEAQGFMEMPPNSGTYVLMDVHGAGAQRSDPKAGNPDDYPTGHGPQGDVITIYNNTRCVRSGSAAPSSGNETITPATTVTERPDAGLNENGRLSHPPLPTKSQAFGKSLTF